MKSIKLCMAFLAACVCALCVSCEMNIVNLQDEVPDIETKSPHETDSKWLVSDEHSRTVIQFRNDGKECKYIGSMVGAKGMYEEYYGVQWLSGDSFLLWRADPDDVYAFWYKGSITDDEMKLVSLIIPETQIVLKRVVD